MSYLRLDLGQIPDWLQYHLNKRPLWRNDRNRLRLNRDDTPVVLKRHQSHSWITWMLTNRFTTEGEYFNLLSDWAQGWVHASQVASPFTRLLYENGDNPCAEAYCAGIDPRSLTEREHVYGRLLPQACDHQSVERVQNGYLYTQPMDSSAPLFLDRDEKFVSTRFFQGNCRNTTTNPDGTQTLFFDLSAEGITTLHKVPVTYYYLVKARGGMFNTETLRQYHLADGSAIQYTSLSQQHCAGINRRVANEFTTHFLKEYENTCGIPTVEEVYYALAEILGYEGDRLTYQPLPEEPEVDYVAAIQQAAQDRQQLAKERQMNPNHHFQNLQARPHVVNTPQGPQLYLPTADQIPQQQMAPNPAEPAHIRIPLLWEQLLSPNGMVFTPYTVSLQQVMQQQQQSMAQGQYCTAVMTNGSRVPVIVNGTAIRQDGLNVWQVVMVDPNVEMESECSMRLVNNGTYVHVPPNILPRNMFPNGCIMHVGQPVTCPSNQLGQPQQQPTLPFGQRPQFGQTEIAQPAMSAADAEKQARVQEIINSAPEEIRNGPKELMSYWIKVCEERPIYTERNKMKLALSSFLDATDSTYMIDLFGDYYAARRKQKEQPVKTEQTIRAASPAVIPAVQVGEAPKLYLDELLRDDYDWSTWTGQRKATENSDGSWVDQSDVIRGIRKIAKHMEELENAPAAAPEVVAPVQKVAAPASAAPMSIRERAIADFDAMSDAKSGEEYVVDGIPFNYRQKRWYDIAMNAKNRGPAEAAACDYDAEVMMERGRCLELTALGEVYVTDGAVYERAEKRRQQRMLEEELQSQQAPEEIPVPTVVEEVQLGIEEFDSFFSQFDTADYVETVAPGELTFTEEVLAMPSHPAPAAVQVDAEEVRPLRRSKFRPNPNCIFDPRVQEIEKKMKKRVVAVIEDGESILGERTYSTPTQVAIDPTKQASVDVILENGHTEQVIVDLGEQQALDVNEAYGYLTFLNVDEMVKELTPIANDNVIELVEGLPSVDVSVSYESAGGGNLNIENDDDEDVVELLETGQIKKVVSTELVIPEHVTAHTSLSDLLADSMSSLSSENLEAFSKEGSEVAVTGSKVGTSLLYARHDLAAVGGVLDNIFALVEKKKENLVEAVCGAISHAYVKLSNAVTSDSDVVQMSGLMPKSQYSYLVQYGAMLRLDRMLADRVNDVLKNHLGLEIQIKSYMTEADDLTDRIGERYGYHMRDNWKLIQNDIVRTFVDEFIDNSDHDIAFQAFGLEEKEDNTTLFTRKTVATVTVHATTAHLGLDLNLNAPAKQVQHHDGQNGNDLLDAILTQFEISQDYGDEVEFQDMKPLTLANYYVFTLEGIALRFVKNPLSFITGETRWMVSRAI